MAKRDILQETAISQRSREGKAKEGVAKVEPGEMAVKVVLEAKAGKAAGSSGNALPVVKGATSSTRGNARKMKKGTSSKRFEKSNKIGKMMKKGKRKERNQLDKSCWTLSGHWDR